MKSSRCAATDRSNRARHERQLQQAIRFGLLWLHMKQSRSQAGYIDPPQSNTFNAWPFESVQLYWPYRPMLVRQLHDAMPSPMDLAHAGPTALLPSLPQLPSSPVQLRAIDRLSSRAIAHASDLAPSSWMSLPFRSRHRSVPEAATAAASRAAPSSSMPSFLARKRTQVPASVIASSRDRATVGGSGSESALPLFGAGASDARQPIVLFLQFSVPGGRVAQGLSGGT